MARRPLNPWIAEFVKDEIEAVLAWSNRKKTKGFIKLENDGRFSDDGSNFRNVIGLSESDKNQVQLIEVLSAGDTAVVVLSDGQTHIKGRLSTNAVETFEAALEEGEQLDLQVTGDVIKLLSFTIVTTAFGSEEDYIQLTIEQIEYCHHLRKNIGDPVSIEKDPRIRPLIGRVIKSLVPTDILEEAEDEQESVHSQVDEVVHASYDSVDVPRSSPSAEPASQLPVVPGIPKTFQPLGAAAAPGPTGNRAQKRSAADAGLEEDGFEIQSGVNLDRPMHAARKPSTNLTSNLLGLLSRQEPEPETIAETPYRVVPQQLHRPQEELEEDEGSAPSRSASQRPEDLTPDHTQEANIPSSPPVPSPPKTLNSRPSPDARNERISKAAARTISRRRTIPYSHRRIPANQKRLLDMASSWVPSLPGQTLPKPNVPIDLLKKWNAPPAKVTAPMECTVAPSPRKSATPRRTTGQKQAAIEPPNSHRRSVSIQSPSAHSDEEIPSSQWPSSQAPSSPQKRPDRPPDSSVGSVIRHLPSVQVDETAPIQSTPDLEISPPKVAPVVQKRAPPSPTRMSTHLPARPNVPPSLNNGYERDIHVAAASRSPKPIPTGPRSLVESHHYRSDFSPRGQPSPGPRRTENFQSPTYRPHMDSSPRRSHAYRPMFDSSRLTTASLSQPPSVGSADMSLKPGKQSFERRLEHSPHPAQVRPVRTQSVGSSSAEAHSSSAINVRASSGQPDRGIMNPTADATSRPEVHNSTTGSRATSQQDLPARSAQQATAKVLRPPPTKDSSASDKRPPFEKTLGPSSRPALHPASSRPGSGQGSVLQQASGLPGLAWHGSTETAVSSPLAVPQQTVQRLPADAQLASRRPTQASVSSSNHSSGNVRPDAQRDIVSSDGPSQIPATRSSPANEPSRRESSPRLDQSRQNSSVVQRGPPAENACIPVKAQVAIRPSQRSEGPALMAPNTRQAYPPFPIRHPTNSLNPYELHRRQRQIHRKEQELANRVPQPHSQQTRPDAMNHQSPARAPSSDAGKFKSRTSTSNTIPADSTFPSSAVPNPADDSSRTPLSKRHLNRLRTGFTGVSGSPANQRRLSKTAGGPDGDVEAEGASAAASDAESRTTVEARRSKFRSMGSMMGFGGPHARGANAEFDKNAQAEADKNRMREFYECYTQLAPGGTFAIANANGRKKKRPRVDVLQWDV